MLHHRSKLRPELLGRALYRLFVEESMERGEFKAMLDTSDRTATRVNTDLFHFYIKRDFCRAGVTRPTDYFQFEGEMELHGQNTVPANGNS